MTETGLCRVGSNACGIFPNPLAHDAIGIVIETVHALRPHALVFHVTVPAFPNGRGAIVNRIETAGILALEKKFIGYVAHAVLGKDRHEDRGSQEARLQAVAMFGEVVAQTLQHSVPGCPLEQAIPQCKQDRCLHRVENLGLEFALIIEKALEHIGFCSSQYFLIL